MPEQMIGGASAAYWKMKCINQASGENPFSKEALTEYLTAFADPAAIHASCEDYRAAATIDIDHDNADQGRRLQMPLQILWAKRGVIEQCFDAMALWRLRAEYVEGQSLDATHYMAEEIPNDTVTLMSDFFARNPIQAEAPG